MQLEHYVKKLERLSECQTIEGSLTIAWMKDDQENKISNYSFPKLKELRGFLQVHKVEDLLSLNVLFPNLSIIRGQTLYEKFVLKITENKDLEEIGLLNLKHIEKGNINIGLNPKLCFADTVNWEAIAPNSNSTKNLIVVSVENKYL